MEERKGRRSRGRERRESRREGKGEKGERASKRERRGRSDIRRKKWTGGGGLGWEEGPCPWSGTSSLFLPLLGSWTQQRPLCKVPHVTL